MSPKDGQAKKRTYRKRERARQEEETRRRIAEAAMELHATVGPARTTISAVAARAGVQRATVYRHFPDEASLFGACSAHWYSLHPPPDPGTWEAIRGADARLRVALRDLYAWYGSDEQMFMNTTRDTDLVPSMAPVMEAARANFLALVSAIARGRPERGRARKRVEAAIAHAAGFGTWYSLTREGGLRDEEAIELMAAAVRAADEPAANRR